jgi:ketosteroid isomerase-like protein
MSNLERMREGYERYNRRDFGVVDDLFDEDIDWRVPVNEPIRGREGVRAFFQGLTEQLASHRIVVDDAVESGDRLVCFVRHEMTTPDGKSGEVEAVHDWRFRDGRVVSLREIADTLAFAVLTGQAPEPVSA